MFSRKSNCDHSPSNLHRGSHSCRHGLSDVESSRNDDGNVRRNQQGSKVVLWIDPSQLDFISLLFNERLLRLHPGIILFVNILYRHHLIVTDLLTKTNAVGHEDVLKTM